MTEGKPDVLEGRVIIPEEAPTLAVEQIRKIVGDLDIESDRMETLEAAWVSLSREDREFIATVPFYSSVAEASKAAGIKITTVNAKILRSPTYAYAIRNAKSLRGAMLQRIAFDHMGLTMIELSRMATEPATDAQSKRVKLEAIKHLHLVTGVVEQAGGVKVSVKGTNVLIDQRRVSVGF